MGWAGGRALLLAAPTLAWALGLGCASGQVEASAREYAVQLAEGEAALAEGAPEVAVQAFGAALVAIPHDARALHGLARGFLDLGDPEPALRVLAELEEYHPDYLSRQAGAERCRALAAAVRSRLAEADSRRALLAARALPAASCGQAESARLLAKSLLAEARRARDERRDDEAIALFREAAGVDFLDPEAFAEVARALLATGRRDEVLEVLSSALLAHPADRGLRDLMVEALVAQ